MPEHQTVKWLKELLDKYPDDAQVRFATGPGNTSYLLSDYMKKDVLWIDIGDEDDV